MAKSERRRRDHVVSVRLLPEELERIRAAADRRGESLSAYMRSAVARAPRTAIYPRGPLAANTASPLLTSQTLTWTAGHAQAVWLS
jgi:uncharacterized protein (DUF1778 family)